MPSATLRVPRDEFRRRLAALPAALAGGPDPLGLVAVVHGAVADRWRELVWEAFGAKSRGLTGTDGVTWPPPARETVARKAGPPPRPGVRRPTLTGPQDRRWRQVYASRLARLRLHLPEAEARARAARLAWAVVKAEGAGTKVGTYGSARVPAGVATGELAGSLRPGATAADGAVVESRPGELAVGTGVPHAAPFHARRPLWPADPPAAWRRELAAALRAGLARAVGRVVADAGGG